MTDEEALLGAVIADPEDDAPRLIYADWLDEHGQGERAEFIRVQVALAGMPPDDERRPPLRHAERRLLRRFAERWAEPLRPVVRCHGYCRGFIEYVSCYAEPFLSGGEALFALAPVRQLHLVNAHQHVEPLSQCAFLSRPLGLSLGSWIDNRGVRVLAQSPMLGRLTSLDLSRNRISTPGARYLARSPYLGSLDDLYLRGNPIPREGRAELRRRFGSRVHF